MGESTGECQSLQMSGIEIVQQTATLRKPEREDRCCYGALGGHVDSIYLNMVRTSIRTRVPWRDLIDQIALLV